MNMKNKQTKKSALQSFSEKVGDALIEALTIEPILPWQKPFDGYGKGIFPFNGVSGKEYQGRNFFALLIFNAIKRHPKGNKSKCFLTFKQALDLGGNVKKGGHGCPIIKWSPIESKKEEDGETVEDGKRKGFFKSYTVFSLAQCENIDISKIKELEAVLPKTVRSWKNSKDCEAFIKAQGEVVEHSAEELAAFFSASPRRVTLPAKKFWKTASEYYSTAFHELAHATANRLKMDFGGYNTLEGRAREEVTVELSAFILCNVLGVAKKESDANSKAYAAQWLTALKRDKSEALKVWDNAQKIANEMLERYKEAA